MTTLTDTAETVLARRYYRPGEDWGALCRRVADAVARGDETLAGQFFDIIYNLDFLPNSPCLMNAGTDIGQLSACFVLPVEDSMNAIFTSVRNGALIHKSGGGTGYSFSRLRPKGSSVNSTQGIASGPLSFAAVFDAATETIKQGGKRRGANMGVLRVDHPDIEEFITAKQDQNKFNNFNFSVAITDAFMEAVRADGKYDLIDPTTGAKAGWCKAKVIFDKIVDNAWKNGEPGVLFIDAANRANPTPQLGTYEATNPCGELWLLPYESCNLGSINLGQFVIDGGVDWDRLRKVARLAVRFLDNVIDCNKFPIPEIEEMTKKTRKIGLGIMGLHDMLIQLEIPYASQEGRDRAGEVMRFIHDAAERESNLLARDKGEFPAYDPMVNSYRPRRNAALTSIQPTGTVSMIADCSSGCEPYFAMTTEKHVLDGEKLILTNKHYREDLDPTIFETAQDISPEDHIRMQAALQNNGVDSSISKTINLPATATREDVRNAYLLGHKLGCKGLTIYRDGSRDSQVLNAPGAVIAATPKVKLDLPDVLTAKRYRLKDIDGGFIYAIVCYDDAGKPMEVFATFPHQNRIESRDRATMWTATCRLISLALRCKVPLGEILKQLDRASGCMLDLPAQLSKLLKPASTSACPECGGDLRYEEGCEKCCSCGYSKCS